MPLTTMDKVAVSPDEAKRAVGLESPPTWGEAFWSGFQVQNPTVNLYRAVGDAIDRADAGPEDLDYRPQDHLDGLPPDPYLLAAINEGDMMLRKQRWTDNMELRQKAEFPGGGWGGFAGGVVDATSVALMASPIGWGLKAGTALKGAAVIGATSGAEAAAIEGVLQTTDPTRTAMESAYSIGGAVVLGHLIGAYVGKNIDAFRPDFAPAAKAMERDSLGQPLVTSKGTDALLDFDTRLSDLKLWLEDAPANTVTAARLAKIATLEAAGHSPRVIVESLVQGVAPEKLVLHDLAPQIADQAAQQDVLARTLGIAEDDTYAGSLPLGEHGGSGGADAVRANDELTLVGGRVVGALASVLPIGRVAQSVSSIAKSLGLSLGEQSMRFINATTGLPAAARDAAETRIKQWTGGRMGAARKEAQVAYTAYKKRMQDEGVPRSQRLGYVGFRQAAANAGRRNDTHEVPEVATTAKAYRTNVLLPGIKESMKARNVDEFIREATRQAVSVTYDEYKRLIQMDRADRVAEARDKRAFDRQQARAATSLRELNAAHSAEVASIERMYKTYEDDLTNAAAITLAARIAGLGESSAAARTALKDQMDGELKAKLAPIKTRQKKHIALVIKAFGEYTELNKTQTANTYGMFLKTHRAQFKQRLADELKTVAKGDRAGERQVRQRVEREARLHLRVARRERSAEMKESVKAYKVDRKALLKQRNETLDEADKLFRETMDDLEIAYAVDRKGDYSEAVFQAYVHETPDGYLTPHVQDGVKALKELLTDEYLSNYLTRVYNHKKLRADGGRGFVRNVTDYYHGLWGKEMADARERDIRMLRHANDQRLAKWAIEDADRAARGLKPRVRPPLKQIEPLTPEQVAYADKLLRAQAEEAAEDALAKIEGYGGRVSAAAMGDRGITSASRASQQMGRTLNVPDTVIEDWLVSDIDELAMRWTRNMAPRIELAKASKYYGTPNAWKLTEDLKDVEAQYLALKRAAETPKAAKKIDDEYKQTLKDLVAMRDRLLGTWNLPDPNIPGWVTTIGTILRDYNFISRMGMMTVSSVSDVAQPVVALGLSRSYGKLLGSLSNGTLVEALRMSNAERRKAGVGMELTAPIISHIPEEHGDITLPFWMGAGSRAFARATGMQHWNVALKSWVGLMIQDEILTLAHRIAPKLTSAEGKVTLRRIALTNTKKRRPLTLAETAELDGLGAGLSKRAENALIRELGDIARFGVDDRMLVDIAAQKHTKIGGLLLANTDEWVDAVAVNAYRSAIAKMTDSMIVTPGAGDSPLFVKGVWPGLLVQFKSFMMASHNRTFIPMLQDPDKLRVMNGVLASAMMGTAVVALKYQIAGREDELKDMYANEQWYALTRLALANSAFASGAMEVESAFGALANLETEGRYAGGTFAGTFGGPTVGLLEAGWKVKDGLFSENGPTASTVHSARLVAPAQNLPGASLLYDWGEDALVENFNLTPRPAR